MNRFVYTLFHLFLLCFDVYVLIITVLLDCLKRVIENAEVSHYALSASHFPLRNTWNLVFSVAFFSQIGKFWLRRCVNDNKWLLCSMFANCDFELGFYVRFYGGRIVVDLSKPILSLSIKNCSKWFFFSSIHAGCFFFQFHIFMFCEAEATVYYFLSNHSIDSYWLMNLSCANCNVDF